MKAHDLSSPTVRASSRQSKSKWASSTPPSVSELAPLDAQAEPAELGNAWGSMTRNVLAAGVDGTLRERSGLTVQRQMTLGEVGDPDLSQQSESYEAPPILREARHLPVLASNRLIIQPKWAVRPVTDRNAKEADRHAPSSEDCTNSTGLPITLKAGIEFLSGISMEDVKVHYNSPSPTHIQALAYTYGEDIYVKQGQERYLPHEAWHVVQQKTGKVPPTQQAGGIALNADNALEAEADIMGRAASAIQTPAKRPDLVMGSRTGKEKTRSSLSHIQPRVIQRVGELAAANHTAQLLIRRGNRRRSIIETQGYSHRQLQFIREQTSNIIEAVVQKLTNDTIIDPSLTKQVDKALTNQPRMRTYVAELMEVGNCGEFADIVFWHIAEHATNTWVYSAHMIGWTRDVKNYDHAFNITYDKEIADPRAFDVRKATVVDAWNNYKIESLEQFLAGDNPYDMRLHKSNIKIHNIRKATGENILGPHVKQVIQETAEEIYVREAQRYEDGAPDIERDAIAANLPGVFDFHRGQNRGVIDTRRQPR